MADTLVDRILHPDAGTAGTDSTGTGSTGTDSTDTRAGAGAGAGADADAAGPNVERVGADREDSRVDRSGGVDPEAPEAPEVSGIDDRECSATGDPPVPPVPPVPPAPVDAVRAAYATAAARDVAAPRSSVAEASGAPTGPGVRAPSPSAVGIPSGVDLEIGLIVTDQALFGSDDEPALLDGEVIPAALARALVSDLPARSRAWIRRLYTRPDTGQLAAMDSRRRLFDDNLRRFISLRDQRCRTPWCDAPIRHVDHARPASRGGPTAASNGDGLSEDCNYVRESPGWRATIESASGDDTLTITTPTGHVYTSRPPPLYRPRPGRRQAASAS